VTSQTKIHQVQELGEKQEKEQEQKEQELKRSKARQEKSRAIGPKLE